MSRYRKFLVAAVGAGVAIGAVYFADSEVYVALVSLATAAGVYRVPNA